MVQRIADVLHYEAHLFLRAFLTNNNRRMMVGIWEARSEAETEVFIIKRTCSYGYKY